MNGLFDKEAFNTYATHPLQSFEWGEFRAKTGVVVIREIIDNTSIQLTIHPVPKTPYTIGYFPKGTMPTENVLKRLQTIGKQYNCIFIQLEPNIQKTSDINFSFPHFDIRKAIRPLFTHYTFVLNLTQSEEEILSAMHPKTRYNIKVAQKKGVVVQEDNSPNAFEQYLTLTHETTKRQGFYAHTQKYHQLMWETLQPRKEHEKMKNNRLTAHLLTASYQGKTLVTWIVFVFHDTLYYPYGASSSQNREVMASNLMMWETIRFGKKHGLKYFDMWGALSHNPNPKDPWYGFHKFKQGYGPQLIEFVGSYDLVLRSFLYEGYKLADILRWFYLRVKKL